MLRVREVTAHPAPLDNTQTRVTTPPTAEVANAAKVE